MELIEENILENSTQLKETIKEIESDVIESAELSGEEGLSTKSIQKPKKPRSEAQKKALEKAQLMRKQKSDERKKMEQSYEEDSDFFKRLTPAQRKELKKLAVAKVKAEEQIPVEPARKSNRREKVFYEEYEPDPSSDEEVIVIKRKPKTPKPQKPKKKKIIYKSESDSSDEEQIVKQIQKPKEKPNVIVNEIYSDDEPEFSYSYKTPLTYSSIARFL
jgi:hypothetical protein